MSRHLRIHVADEQRIPATLHPVALCGRITGAGQYVTRLAPDVANPLAGTLLDIAEVCSDCRRIYQERRLLADVTS